MNGLGVKSGAAPPPPCMPLGSIATMPVDPKAAACCAARGVGVPSCQRRLLHHYHWPPQRWAASRRARARTARACKTVCSKAASLPFSTKSRANASSAAPIVCEQRPFACNAASSASTAAACRMTSWASARKRGASSSAASAFARRRHHDAARTERKRLCHVGSLTRGMAPATRAQTLGLGPS